MTDAVEIPLVDAEATVALGRRLATLLRAGDLVVLVGNLGAGKTTLTRGIGEGLGVRGAVTSPTFVIAREHPSMHSGPSLLHVDAYRIGSWSEIDDLDLAVDDTVTVVEWGAGRVEHLVDSHLSVSLVDAGDGRMAYAQAVGPRWSDVDLDVLRA